MNKLFSLVALFISISAGAADQKSSLDALKLIPSGRAHCDSALKEFRSLTIKDGVLSDEQVAKTSALLSELHYPTLEQKKLIETAVAEDPAASIPYFFGLSDCPLVRSETAKALISTADKKRSNKARDLLRQLLLKEKFETLIDAITDENILATAVEKKVFILSPQDTDKLTRLGRNMRAEAKACSDKIRGAFPEMMGAEKLTPEQTGAKLRKNPNYLKMKGVWVEEVRMAKTDFEEIRKLLGNSR